MKKYTYNVEWIGDLYNAATTVIITEPDTDTAIDEAERQMQEHYGYDFGDTATVSVSAELQWIDEGPDV